MPNSPTTTPTETPAPSGPPPTTTPPADTAHLARRIVETLAANGQTLALAESCTGGLLGAAITSVPGASKVFPGGGITYSADAKQSLGVPAATLDQHGVVSAQCAAAMAQAAAKFFNTTHALSTTGIAGPGGATAQNPVGTVFIGLHTPEGTTALRQHFPGPRETVRAAAVHTALEKLSHALSQPTATAAAAAAALTHNSPPSHPSYNSPSATPPSPTTTPPATAAADSAAHNVARHLREAARRSPDFPAVLVPNGTDRATGQLRQISRTFAELDRESDAAAALFAQRGITPGTKTLLLARPGLDLILSMFALLKLGAVPIAIDPGMGLRAFLRCVKNTRPEAAVGMPLALALAWFFRDTFRSVKIRIRTGPLTSASPVFPVHREGPSHATASSQPPPPPPENTPALPRPIYPATPDTPAAVLFTSGSTGAPKGARYTHAMLDAQLALVRDAYGIRPGEVDLPMLPVFALFNPALGTTTVTPDMNPSRPATADPDKIIRSITQNAVNYSFGSPALWTKIARHCEAHALTLPTIRRVLIAGAPVHPRLLRALRLVLPNAEIHTPYGATEVLPVASISATEVLGETWEQTLRGHGTCVGAPLPGVRVKIIPVRDGPLSSLADAGEVPPGEPGEIIVNSPTCTREYDNNPDATRLAKIPDADGSVWHRMGDIGRLDDRGRLWFFGRKVEVVHTATGPLYTEVCEAIFNAHPHVFRTALIGLGEPNINANPSADANANPAAQGDSSAYGKPDAHGEPAAQGQPGGQTPAIVVEPFPGHYPRNAADRARFIAELRALGAAHAATSPITRFFFDPAFPVDTRHNAKIHRLTLRKKWMRK